MVKVEFMTYIRVPKLIHLIVAALDKHTLEIRFFIFHKFKPKKVIATGMFSSDAFRYLMEICKDKNILEYGSGGSTLILGTNCKSVTSIESDKHFARMVSTQVNHMKNTQVHYVNVGLTKSYGHPLRILRPIYKSKYKKYSEHIWTIRPSISYDVVIIDGRFRVASALQSIISNSRPFHLVVDDYKSRKQYWEIAKYVGMPKEVLGETAFFEVPKDINLKMIKEKIMQYSFNDA